MNVKLTKEILKNYARMSELRLAIKECKSQISLIKELRLTQQFPGKLAELKRAKESLQHLYAELPQGMAMKLVDVSKYGPNAFNWPINETTLTFHALEALGSCGILSQAAREAIGLEVSTSHLYPDEC